jgi:hypothetical protein
MATLGFKPKLCLLAGRMGKFHSRKRHPYVAVWEVNVVKVTWRILEPETTAATLRLSGADFSKAKACARKLGEP